MPDKKLVILGTGGTIAGTASSDTDNIGYTAGQVSVQKLVAAVPALETGGALELEQIAQIDSKDMSFSVLKRLAVRIRHFLALEEVAGVVVTHGTDTIEETAFFLQAVLSPLKPVVLTCAMRPASSREADGPQNIADAVLLARQLPQGGVVVSCAGVVHGADEIQKVHTSRLDPFSSGDGGPRARIVSGEVTQLRQDIAVQPGLSESVVEKILDPANAAPWPWVEIVISHAGARPEIVNALVVLGVKGIVLAGTGNGTIHEVLELALVEAQAKGVRVVRASRCVGGGVTHKAGDAFESCEGLSPVKARIALMLDLMRGEFA